MILAGALAADNYWTERVSLPDSTFVFLQPAASEGVPDLLWIDGPESGLIPILEIVERAGALRYAPLTALYWRADQAIKDKRLLAYRNQDGPFARAEAGTAGQGGEVACGRHRSRVTAQNLWGRSAAISLAIGVPSARSSRNPCATYINPPKAIPTRPARYTLPMASPLQFYSMENIQSEEVTPDIPIPPVAPLVQSYHPYRRLLLRWELPSRLVCLWRTWGSLGRSSDRS